MSKKVKDSVAAAEKKRAAKEQRLEKRQAHKDSAFVIRALLRLDMKSRFGYGAKINASNVGKWIFSFVMTAAMYTVLVFLIYFFTKMFVVRPGLRDSYIILVSMASIILQFFICTVMLIKALYYSGDNEILLRFPVNGTQIFIAKSIFVLIYNFIITIAMLLPFYISYGVILTKLGVMQGNGFYAWAVLVTVISSFLPFFVANIVAIPIMKAMAFIKDKYLIVLLVTVGAVIGLFILYMSVLQSLVTFYIEQEMALFSPAVVGKISGFASKAFPFNIYGNLLRGEKIGLSLLYISLLTIGVGVIAAFVVKKWYFKTILDGVENQRASFTKRTSNRRLPPFISYIKREFLGIVRSFNYSFQYIVMAAAAPVMVYYCNSLAGAVGSSSVGNNILPGISLMVITIFVTVIVSFSSTAISREGGCFYQTKIIPVPYWEQILSKFLLYSGVATLSTLFCCVAVAEGGFVSRIDAVIIFCIAEFSNLALTSLCMWFDTKKPSFNFMGDGELVSANKNVAIAMTLGLVLALLYGLLTMIGGFLPTFLGIVIKNGARTMLLLWLLVSALLAVVGLVVLFVKLNKRYNKLYQ